MSKLYSESIKNSSNNFINIQNNERYSHAQTFHYDENRNNNRNGKLIRIERYRLSRGTFSNGILNRTINFCQD